MTIGKHAIKAAGAIVVLATFAVGLPWLNTSTGGRLAALLPRSWPNLSDPQLLDHTWASLRWSFVDGTAWPWLAHVTLWCVWLIGLYWIVADIVAVVRRGAVQVGRRVAAWTPRTWVSGLVATIIIALANTAASADAVAPSAATTLVITQPVPPGPGLRPVEIQVQPHDTLWDIARRELGDGTRWHDLWDWNRGVLQRDGRALTRPHLIRPGWTLVAYVPPPPPAPPSTTAAPPPQVPPNPASTTNPPLLDEHTAPQPANPRQAHGIQLSTGAYVSLALAAAITSAVTSVLVWRRRHYRVGSGTRADLHQPFAPVVRALRVAHDDGQPAVDDVEYIDLTPPPPQRHLTAVPSREQDHKHRRISARVGVRAGHVLAVNVAATRGLGLTGPGAINTARALLVHLLAEHQHSTGIRVIIPACDLRFVIGGAGVDRLPSTVLVVDSLDAALAETEATLLTRTRTRHALQQTAPLRAPAPLVLIARPLPQAEGRLRAVLDNGTTLGMAGILLGQWQPGVTICVRADGTVTDTSPGIGDPLAGARLFTLPGPDVSALLAVLRDAEGPADGLTRDQPPLVPEQPTVERTQPASTPPPAPHGHAVIASTPRTPRRDVQSVSMDAQLQPATPRFAQGRTDNRGTAATDVVGPHRRPSQVDQPIEPKPDTVVARRPLAIRVLGRVHLIRQEEDGEYELSGVLTPKYREMILCLALHPQGVRREALNDAVWPDSRPPRAYNSFHNTLSVLRRAVSDATRGAITNFVLNHDGRYRLNADLVTVDLWHLQHSLHAQPRAGGHDQDRFDEVIELYQAHLAEDLTARWIEPFRESLRRDVLDALGAVIRSHRDTNPDTELVLLERARKLDRYNEGIYRDIIRTQARLGQFDAIPRTLALLATTLEEIGHQPGTETRILADVLSHRGSTPRPDAATNTTPGASTERRP
ncbi:LysM peptidoglycan-binding domain-containing protein [Actinocrispum wychmicini]|uniref:DNA-binding SARP family transcriptional activator n=1 Tax=Actinocrispum wychmicini TaxID=1213861 RepID=A0A4R2IZ77_9PSEU|nr:LysM peptidoglycan-binding domain-containing protein [Actinocrispum wychmicini]TCO49648.1 DNA-binding SARP family transcriptional activator [Actinocrispum wychmicini]